MEKGYKDLGLSKIDYHNYKQCFYIEFKSGKYKVAELARKYGLDIRRVRKWKEELFGKENIRQLRMYQMHKANIPSSLIAEFYEITQISVNKHIREYRERKEVETDDKAEPRQ